MNNLIVNDWLEYLESMKNNSSNTTESYKHDIVNFLQFIKFRLGLSDTDKVEEIVNINIDDVDEDILKRIGVREIIAYISYTDIHLKNSTRTRSRKLSSLRSFFNYIYKVVNIIDENPMTLVEGPKLKKSLPEYMDLLEVKKLLETILENTDDFYRNRDFAVVMTFLNTGLRLNELVNLKLDDLDKESITILGKGNKERIIHLNESNLKAIRNYLDYRPDSDLDYLFLNKQGTNNFGQRGIQHMLKKYTKQAGLSSKISPHTLRHTAATLLYQHGGVDLRTLQELLGHESLSTTQIYTHVDSRQIEAAVKSNPIEDLDLNIKDKE